LNKFIASRTASSLKTERSVAKSNFLSFDRGQNCAELMAVSL
jgi:hypothetical protein